MNPEQQTWNDNDVLMWLMGYNKCSTLPENVDNGGSDTCIQAGGIWEMSVSSV